MIGVRDLQLALRVSAAGGLAAWAAWELSLKHPIYAFIAAVIVTDLSPAQSRRLGLRRIFATILGAACGAIVSAWIGSGPLPVAGGVAVAMLASYALGAGEAARVAGYICGIVVIDHVGEPVVYAAQRFVETFLGVVVAWAISFVPKLVRTDSGGQG
jgi:uncharacterized membrane protein YgaE (UPF0421/DUF939 family)